MGQDGLGWAWDGGKWGDGAIMNALGRGRWPKREPWALGGMGRDGPEWGRACGKWGDGDVAEMWEPPAPGWQEMGGRGHYGCLRPGDVAEKGRDGPGWGWDGGIWGDGVTMDAIGRGTWPTRETQASPG